MANLESQSQIDLGILTRDFDCVRLEGIVTEGSAVISNQTGEINGILITVPRGIPAAKRQRYIDEQARWARAFVAGLEEPL